ncbi:Vacuolar iron transporter-like protein [Schleiferilactobacillus shenzhenensis LY-73]|uniref:Vacuolar iron transporter-like protein n=2 Tax=Schleiferilactobacillus shenzhenensis TaxID=1231337 RepID=U4TV10_9LACO|nr:Vacuolar iron transporter-like protein [Schleiferilactobacillus shenzhenensis LY-73]
MENEAIMMIDSNKTHLTWRQRLSFRRDLGNRLNVLRAAVMGANDGIISTAGIVMGVAGANMSATALMLAGVSAMISGALSMGGGEYMSVSAQRDLQNAIVQKEEAALRDDKTGSFQAMYRHYLDKGYAAENAAAMAHTIVDNNDIATILAEKFQIKLDKLLNPWLAAGADFFAFILGALLPLLCITLIPNPYKVGVTMAAVVVCLFGTGYTSAKLSQVPARKGALRNMVVGMLTMVVGFIIGSLIG